MKTLNIDNLAPRVAIYKPTVVGAAFRIFLMGGSDLSETQRGQAAGSAFLLKSCGDQIMELVDILEDRASNPL